MRQSARQSSHRTGHNAASSNRHTSQRRTSERQPRVPQTEHDIPAQIIAAHHDNLEYASSEHNLEPYTTGEMWPSMVLAQNTSNQANNYLAVPFRPLYQWTPDESNYTASSRFDDSARSSQEPESVGPSSAALMYSATPPARRSHNLMGSFHGGSESLYYPADRPELAEYGSPGYFANMQLMHDDLPGPYEHVSAVLPSQSPRYSRSISPSPAIRQIFPAEAFSQGRHMERTASDGSPPPPRDGRSEESSPSRDGRREYRCWEGNCNGRRFSSNTNLQRHQREQPGHENVQPVPARRWVCPRCGERFTRSTALRNHRERGTCERRQERALARAREQSSHSEQDTD